MIIPQANVLAIRAFGGMSPRMSPYLIDDRAAVESENVNMLRGVLEPLKANEPIRVADRTKGLIAYGRDKFVTLGRKSDGSAVIGDRLVFADVDGPTYIDTVNYDDEAETPAKHKFGMPDLLSEWVMTPGDRTTGHSPAVEEAGGGGGSGNEYRYAIAVANMWGDESALSKAGVSELEANTTSFTATLTEAQVDSLRTLLDGHQMDGMVIRLYRSTEAGTHLLIHEEGFPASGNGFTHMDVLANTELGASKVNDGLYVRLPDDAKGFVWHPNGFMACYATVDGVDYVYFSSPASVSHFPETTRVDPHGGKIVGLEEYGNRIVIFFENGPPKTLVEVAVPGFARLISPEIAHRTISGASVSKSANGIMYASRDGIVVTDGIQGRLMDELFDADSFNEYSPVDIRGYATDLDYYMFGPGRRNFLLQRMGMMTHLDEVITDMSQYSDHVYALVGDVIFEMFASRDDILRQARWRSKKFAFQRPTLLKSAKLNADYERFNIETLTGGLGFLDELGDIVPGDFRQLAVTQTDPARLTVRVIKDDHEVSVEDIRTSWPWNFPNVFGARKSTTFQVEITTNTPVYSIGLAPNIRTFDAVPIPTTANIDPSA